MPIMLAIDQSTSATKALLFDQNASLIDQASLSHRQIYPQPGWVEHDAGEIYANTLAVIRSLLEKNPDRVEDLLCLSLTNQRETFVLFDRRTGEPLYNAIVWQCRRGEKVCAGLAAAGDEEPVHRATGLKIDTYFPASKLRWLLDERPDLGRRLAVGSALFGTMDTYLIYRLTGGQVYATDHTNASRTLFYDIETLDWSPDLCRLFGASFARLPEIRESAACFGETTLEGLLPRPLPIAGVMGDSQAALFAQRCFTPGSAKVTFGTGSSLLLNLGAQKKLSSSGVVTAIGWVLNGQPTYAFEGITNFTGATIAWLRDQLQLIRDPAETEALARSVPDNGGVYLVPAFVGLSAPYWRPDVRAAISGLTPSSTRAHVVRAALESIAYVVTDALRSMEQEAGLPLQMVHADGGAVRNAFLMQFVADINGKSVRASHLPELSALGAVFSGGLGMKAYASLEDLNRIPIGFTTYAPLMARSQVEAHYAGWQHAVRQVLA
ncbi:MAG TPA: glycerol kinase GlpK [Anaerolineaceae bacterium]|nr:glycerol kinase GlpK [Anaerolineaceae bacterium]